MEDYALLRDVQSVEAGPASKPGGSPRSYYAVGVDGVEEIRTLPDLRVLVTCKDRKIMLWPANVIAGDPLPPVVAPPVASEGSPPLKTVTDLPQSPSEPPRLFGLVPKDSEPTGSKKRSTRK